MALSAKCRLPQTPPQLFGWSRDQGLGEERQGRHQHFESLATHGLGLHVGAIVFCRDFLQDQLLRSYLILEPKIPTLHVSEFPTSQSRCDAYARRGNPRGAVERCVAAAQTDARRYGYRYAQVTDIRDVDDTRYGWRVKGRMMVDGQRGYRNSRYDRRYNDRSRDSGKFTCYIERGRVADVNYSGIRGLR